MAVYTIKSNGRPAEILLVEDNYGDVLLTKKAFSQTTITTNFTIAKNGIEALEILKHQGQHKNAPAPDLILLDLNLPKKSGHEVLIEIKSDNQLRHIPVIILSSSQAETDIQTCYQNYANSYIVKPNSIEKFDEIVSIFEKFWFSIVVLQS